MNHFLLIKEGGVGEGLGKGVGVRIGVGVGAGGVEVVERFKEVKDKWKKRRII